MLSQLFTHLTGDLKIWQINDSIEGFGKHFAKQKESFEKLYCIKDVRIKLEPNAVLWDRKS